MKSKATDPAIWYLVQRTDGLVFVSCDGEPEEDIPEWVVRWAGPMTRSEAWILAKTWIAYTKEIMVCCEESETMVGGLG